GNNRDMQFFEFDHEIERTLTKNRNMVKFQKSLQRERQEEVSQEFSEEEIHKEIFEEKIQDNMADESNNQRRTLGDFIIPTTVSCG
ncbi:hypothetical protein PIB30_095183, partial [Stylosanthes scabra]|nr:hypothetical protein [Stylosanthes scabra]